MSVGARRMGIFSFPSQIADTLITLYLLAFEKSLIVVNISNT